jgi:hypothetical protein
MHGTIQIHVHGTIQIHVHGTIQTHGSQLTLATHQAIQTTSETLDIGDNIGMKIAAADRHQL